MGRYYSGDIEGKFWFAVQSSDAPERFGCYETKDIINYYVDDIKKVKNEIEFIKKNLGKWKKKLDNFFKKNNYYDGSMLITQLKMPATEINFLIREYADLILGEKILECIKEHGYCSFEAEY